MGKIAKALDEYIDQIRLICLQNNVNSLFAFGSVTNPNFNDSSDIDLLIEIKEKDPFSYADNYFNTKFQIENLLKRKIDLLEEKAIKNPFFKDEIDKTKILIYAK